jgi:hypothetical protein
LDLKKTKQAFIALIADDAANSISTKCDHFLEKYNATYGKRYFSV